MACVAPQSAHVMVTLAGCANLWPRRRPERNLPESVPPGIADAGDHFPPTPLDFFARNAPELRDRLGVPVAPGLPNSGERLTRNANGIENEIDSFVNQLAGDLEP